LIRIKTSEYADMTPADIPAEVSRPASDGSSQDLDVIKRAQAALSWGAPIPRPVEPVVWPAPFTSLVPEQRRLALVTLATMGRTLEEAAPIITTHRDLLRAGALRRTDDVELLTILLRLWLGRPLQDPQTVADVRATYDHLRRSHWWPQGPADLPLGAILACRPEPMSEVIHRIEALQLSLAEGDEVPDQADDLVTLMWSNDSTNVLIERLHDLRTALLLSGIALQAEDAAAVVRLALIDRPSDEVIAQYLGRRRWVMAETTCAVVGQPLFMVADAVLLDLLTGSARQVVIAQVVMHAWMALREGPPGPGRLIPGPLVGHRNR
jgi:hypothetical protein